MGTYCYAVLNVNNDELKNINETLAKLGYPNTVENGVEYGAFFTDEMIDEDVRYMNEDPEGLKQCPGWSRPITREYLLTNWPFTRHKQFCQKYSCNKDFKLISIVLKWLWEHMELVDHEESRNYTKEEVIHFLDLDTFNEYFIIDSHSRTT